MSTTEFAAYVPLIPLPAPVTSGSAIQVYTDPYGDVWVAKNGVDSGNWHRARDVLYCRITRTAAYTLPASPNGVAMPWDGAVAGQDKYGMYNGTGITVPIGGIWMFGAVIELNNTAVNQVLGYYVGASRSSTNQMPGTGFPLRVAHTTTQITAANAAVNVVFEYTTASLVMTVGTGDRCHMWAQYLGTS
jgi:hypothetical protein